MKIDQDVLTVLDAAAITGREVRLSNAIARPLYVKVDKVLKAAGGKWNRRAGAHVFEEEPAAILEQAMLTGTILSTKQELGVFYTPAAVAQRAVKMLEIEPGMTVLDPSAGRGALSIPARDAGATVTCLDILNRHVEILRDAGFRAAVTDFLEWGEPTQTYDRVLMNPPFAQQADAMHFMRGILWLRPGGRMVAIMSAAVKFRQSRLYAAVREAIHRSGGVIDDLPPNSFKESGTGVNAVMVSFNAVRS